VQIALNPDQYDFLVTYVDVLRVVETGFNYVVKKYGEYDFPNGTLVLSDIFLAFHHFEEANKTMHQIFEGDVQILSNVERFAAIIDILSELELCYLDEEEREQIITNQLHPAYQNWKEPLEKSLEKYIYH
jgi:hypothetical protein